MRRGYILDSKGSVLALSIETKSVYANPEEIEQAPETARVLAASLQMDEAVLIKRLSLPRKFIWIKRKISDITYSRIKEMNLKGIHFKNEFKRVYPNETLLSHILGFTDVDNNGISGLEYKYDDYLKGDVDLETVDEDQLVYGYTIVLTIDRYIQNLAEKYLAEAVQTYKGKKGAVVVTNVRSGKILAFAVCPAFNPNYYNRYNSVDRMAYSIVEPFEPGSTMKIFSAAAWLEAGRVPFDKKYNGSGTITIYDTTIKSTHVNGWITMADAVRLSCNVSVIRAMMDVRSDELYNTLQKFGFGQKVCSDLPGESSGILRETSRWSGLSKFSISIGQEISVNALQLVAAYGAVANGGIYIQPSLIDSIESNSGHRIQKFYPKSKGRIISEAHAEIMRKMLLSVVESGTGTRAAVTGYRVAGKTGTAQKSLTSGGYIEGAYTASFVGFAPYDDPEIAVLVIVDEPGTPQTHGGEIAAPVFSKLATEVLPYLGAGIKEVGVYAPLGSLKSPVPQFDGTTMPDFTGLAVADALLLIETIKKEKNVIFGFKGTGRVVGQSPESGTALEVGEKIILKFE